MCCTGDQASACARITTLIETISLELAYTLSLHTEHTCNLKPGQDPLVTSVYKHDTNRSLLGLPACMRGTLRNNLIVRRAPDVCTCYCTYQTNLDG